MTDDNLNRAVARIIDETHGAPATNEPRNVPAYCTDPAAWGALLVWLAEQKRQPSLYHSIIEQAFIAGVERAPSNSSDGRWAQGIDPHPGRALILATLKAWGVEAPND